MKKFFEVQAKCGHVGKDRYFRGTFYVIAQSGKEAAAQVRNFPRVKHHHKDAIIGVTEITESQYELGLAEIRNNPYYICTNVQEQRAAMEDILDFIEDEIRTESKEDDRVVARKARIRRNNIISKLQQECAAREALWAC